MADAQVSALDRGFLFADGVYEVTAVLDGRLVDTATVYPFQPRNDVSGATVTLAALAKRHGVAYKARKAAPQKKGPGLGSVVAIVLGAAAAVGVLYAAWQALRADDELWVADDPLSAPAA